MKTLKTLIVDDVKLIRIELRMLLSNYKEIDVIGEAGNVKEALKFIYDEKPDVLFLDIYLPDSSGFELLDKLEMDLKVIFISSYFNKYSSEILKYNPVDILSKPINKTKLSDAIKKLTEYIHNE